jgi:hypothetical protein
VKRLFLMIRGQEVDVLLDEVKMDFRFMERPSARQIQMDLFYDYRNNVGVAEWDMERVWRVTGGAGPVIQEPVNIIF